MSLPQPLSPAVWQVLKHQLEGSLEMWTAEDRGRHQTKVKQMALIRKLLRDGRNARTTEIGRFFVAEDAFYRFCDPVLADINSLLRRVRNCRRGSRTLRRTRPQLGFNY